MSVNVPSVKNQIYSKFSPTNIPGCHLWLDAADTSTTGTGSTISTWVDKSQFGRNMSPASNTTLLSPGNYVQLNGSAMYTGSVANVDLYNCTFAVVSSAGSSGVDNQPVFSSYGGASSQSNYQSTCGFGFYLDSGSNRYRVYGQYNSGATGASISNVNAAIQNPSIVINVLNSSGAITSYINGSNALTATALARTTPATGFTIGGEGAGYPFTVYSTMSAKIYEIVVYNTILSTDEQNQLQGYLAYKWGLQSLIPTSITPGLPTGYVVWYDASLASSITQVSGNVSRWNDLSGNNNHLVTTSGPIIYRTDSPYTANGTVVFPNSSTTMISTNRISYAIDTTEVYVVARLTAMNAQNFDMLFCMVDDTTNGNVGDLSIRFVSGILYDGNSGDIGTGGRYYVNGVNAVNTSTTTYTNSYFLISSKFANQGSGTSHVQVSSTFFSRWWYGNIGEVVVYPTPLTTNQRLSAQAYFAAKWTVPIVTSTNTWALRAPVLKSFDPTTISNCLVWLDAADNSTITGTSSVSSWTNKGANAGSAVLGAGTVSTGYSLSSNVNGLNFLRIPFGSYLNFTTSLTASVRTWFWVLRITGLVDSSHNVYFVQATTTSSDSAYFSYYSSTSNALQVGPNGIAFDIEARVASSLLSNVVAVYTSVNSTNTSSNIVTYDGSNVPLSISAAASSYNAGNITYRLGNGGVDFMETLYYSRDLTAGERKRVEGYLGQKWGLKSSYEVTHPYKYVPPYTIV